MDYASRVAEQFARITPVQSKLGIFVERAGTHAVVNLGDGTVRLPFVGMYLPPSGHPVQVESRDGKTVVTGPARPLPGAGVIVTVNAPYAAVLAWDIMYTLPYRAGYEPSSGHNVEISWSADGGVIQGQVSAISDDPTPDVVPPPSGGSFHPAPFTAIDSGTYNPAYGKWISGDVWASTSTTSAWFYGSKVVDSIPDAATITLARIYLPPRSTSGAAPILQAHSAATKPGGAVTFIGSGYPLPARAGWVDIPAAFIDHLKVNGGGLGFNHGGYNIYAGVGSDGLSGALDIAWIA